MILKSLSRRFIHFGIVFQNQWRKQRRFLYCHHVQYYEFSKTKSGQYKPPFKNEQNSQKTNDKGNEFSKNYIKFRLHHNNSKTDPIFVHILINLKVTFPQQGSKQTKITKIQTVQESNEPCIIMALDKSKFPPEDNMANEEIQRFWNHLIEEQLDFQDAKILTQCEIVGGKTSKRKNLAFTVELNKRSSITLESMFENFDTFLKR